MSVKFAFRSKPAVTVPSISRAARMLALAHHVERSVDAGTIKTYAEAARALGLTRARLTQVMRMLVLSPVIQARLLTGELVATERSLRAVVQESDWQKQLDVLGRSINHSSHE